MTTDIKRVGILAHPQRPQTAPVAEQIARYLESHNIHTCVHTQWEENDVVQDVQATEMVIAIGGDGAMLRAARVCAPFGVPVLGVNMGQLGFLTEISSADSWQAPLEAILRGEYWIEARMMLYAALVRGDVVVTAGDALNDVVISRGIAARTIRLETYIDKDWTTTYNADALIVATATGSTAYALACGGPILPPELRNILIVPVAPHLTMDRPIVLAEGSTVDVISAPDNLNEIVLTVDGTMLGEVNPGDTIRIQASQHVSRFIRLREKNYFYRSLLDRLEPRLPVRSRPDKKQL
ncbi:MAG: NAD(+)/NADH kinase [Anaerolineae bacterium]|nr:NAD(+)/NADH kinase [Anaerolineae bacterium]